MEEGNKILEMFQQDYHEKKQDEMDRHSGRYSDGRAADPGGNLQAGHEGDYQGRYRQDY